jgi:hypothetical protein
MKSTLSIDEIITLSDWIGNLAANPYIRPKVFEALMRQCYPDIASVVEEAAKELLINNNNESTETNP